ncbi:MAG: anthranilate synthase component I [Sporolactobacillus sp.]
MSLLADFDPTVHETQFTTSGGLCMTCRHLPLQKETDIPLLIKQLNTQKGGLFSSNYTYPGRYSRWDVGFVNPPIELTAKQDQFQINALNARGEIILSFLSRHLSDPAFAITVSNARQIRGQIQHVPTDMLIREEVRTRQPSVFSLLRQIKNSLASEDPFLGLYGAFGFDLILQFEQMPQRKSRDAKQNDLQLYLPDELLVLDHEKQTGYRLCYEFTDGDCGSTSGLPRDGASYPYDAAFDQASFSSFANKDGDYAEMVRRAKEAFINGDLFEVVPSRVLSEPCQSAPSQVFERLRTINPSPYGFLLHLSDQEFLIGCSPEMYVRVDGATVETCPISGTIKRHGSVIEDAEQIKTLLGSHKEESELTMCTDVDRNDKSRVCRPGSVTVVGRRQIEAYSHLFHTVDHVKGVLKPGFDALDAFMSHMWAVTITGAPKIEAMNWIEAHEQVPRSWYGGAIGYLLFNGNMNTGLTLRTLRLHNGVAQIRGGATLLYDSVPEQEEQETLTKAGALLEAVRTANSDLRSGNHSDDVAREHPGQGLRLLLVDHEDSFVHTLSGYFQQLGAQVTVCRSEGARRLLRTQTQSPDLVVLSPGPGSPERFQMNETIRLCLERSIPLFGICLGLQGIVRYFGGELALLPEPVHGKASLVRHSTASQLFQHTPPAFKAGRYHSIYASSLPSELVATASTEAGIVMAVEHSTLPVSAVQFHPESIMTARNAIGMKILENVLSACRRAPAVS